MLLDLCCFLTVHLEIRFSSVSILWFSFFSILKFLFFLWRCSALAFRGPIQYVHYFVIQFCTFRILFSFFVVWFFCMHFLRYSLNESFPPSPSPPLPSHNFKTLEWNNLHHDIFHRKLGRPRLYSPLGFSRSHPFHIKPWYQRYKNLEISCTLWYWCWSILFSSMIVVLSIFGVLFFRG